MDSLCKFSLLIIVLPHGRSPCGNCYYASFLCLLSFEKESKAWQRTYRIGLCLFYCLCNFCCRGGFYIRPFFFECTQTKNTSFHFTEPMCFYFYNTILLDFHRYIFALFHNHHCRGLCGHNMIPAKCFLRILCCKNV